MKTNSVGLRGWLNHLILLCLIALPAKDGIAAALTETVKQVTPSVVAIALYSPLDSPQPDIRGTGFVVGDGKTIITNYHVVEKSLDPTIVQHYVALSGTGQRVQKFKAEVGNIDPKHDLAVLKIEQALPAMQLADTEFRQPGSEVAFTGFPIGAVLGLYPATHRGLLAAITPDAIPTANSSQLSLKMLDRLEKPDMIYQLDATAYPGNSGSPVYDPETGEVIAIISKVLVRDTKESALSSPTGISYGVPVKYLKALLER
ncbi:S1 family peptidase [Alteromonas halophila]|uniref:Serine protease n=1 Tax=Alteromonas halophila TaxID=516698 RepID=A0A918JMW3_9ALTE|nr:serine protease [Alteromonas halophila]GGW86842.1 hypothetical protein GCM10007391_20730 [Alteromonas halophila]